MEVDLAAVVLVEVRSNKKYRRKIYSVFRNLNDKFRTATRTASWRGPAWRWIWRRRGRLWPAAWPRRRRLWTTWLLKTDLNKCAYRNYTFNVPLSI